ncbi:3-oxo-5-alpha-steroid 4-dehydrogenase-domain-containing protein [Zychaea mexicana]|uniref:3-oxo-5-alpha-steroid 4-dehydrogenase-domain-containing protein n=1 Tax=Zychaea mexicana TaxID=64656 RepID=UPI0022FE716D|nr:3-oxo-5-alpha-steroid 4-dehydrogenase-domain-containing protein [Zychaea mexicana]KAI9490633.1 3-oxo-5-alpha-steroid 4-dehydrogenase-domain-containing protein [Zychaea mexicana]
MRKRRFIYHVMKTQKEIQYLVWRPTTATKFTGLFLPYGKLNITADKPQSPLGHWLAQLTVPKSWFSHFYIVGFAFALESCIEIALLLLWQPTKNFSKAGGPILTLVRTLDTAQGSTHIEPEFCVLALVLMTMHLGRRVYESLCVERPSRNARMHISHYATGLGFYGAMVVATWIEGAANLGLWNSDTTTVMAWKKAFAAPTILVRTTLAVALFAYASNHQHTCHHILASLREKRSGYQIPRGDWFESVVVPHYLADILIYFALCILHGFGNWTLLCGLVWTIVNLSITADETEAWYKTTFDDRYKKAFPKGRWIILPWVY